MRLTSKREKSIRETHWGAYNGGKVCNKAIKDLLSEIDHLRESIDDWKKVVKVVSQERDHYNELIDVQHKQWAAQNLEIAQLKNLLENK